jgi:hypothetical protein
MMAPARKSHTASKISAKKARVSARDPMVELEEGLFRLTTHCNSMDFETHTGPVFYDPMDLDWIGIIEALMTYFLSLPEALSDFPPIQAQADFPPPAPLIRSQADFPPPSPLIRSQADFSPMDQLRSAAGIV